MYCTFPGKKKSLQHHQSPLGVAREYILAVDQFDVTRATSERSFCVSGRERVHPSQQRRTKPCKVCLTMSVFAGRRTIKSSDKEAGDVTANVIGWSCKLNTCETGCGAGVFWKSDKLVGSERKARRRKCFFFLLPPACVPFHAPLFSVDNFRTEFFKVLDTQWVWTFSSRGN